MKSSYFFWLAIWGVFLPLASPSYGEQVTFWHTMNTDESKSLAKVIADFEASNPDIKVNLQNVPFSDAQNKFKIAAQAGNAPDLFRSEIAWVPGFSYLGFLEEIVFSEADKRDFLPLSLQYGLWEGKYYGIPQVTDCLALFYNKRIFRENKVNVPSNLEELASLGKVLSNPKQKKWALSFNPAGYWAQIFIWAFGGGLIDGTDQSIHITDPGSAQGMQYMVDLMQVNHTAPSEMDFVNGYNNMMTGFKQGRFAMIINGPWSTSDVLSGDEFKDPENLGIAVIPRGPKGYFSPVGGHSYVISNRSKVKPAALRLANFLSETKNQIIFAKNHNLLPTRYSAWNSPEIKSNRLISNFKAQLDLATSRPVIPEGGAIYDALDKAVENTLSLNRAPEPALRKVAKQWTKLLKHRKKT